MSSHKFKTPIIFSGKTDTSTQEQHWGEILERTVSKQNLMLVNGRTNGNVLTQTLPKRNKSNSSEFKSTLSLELKSQNRIIVNAQPQNGHCPA